MNYITLTDCPYYLITRASVAITGKLKKEFANSGIEEVKPAYIGVLMCLWLHDGMEEVLGKLGCEEGMKLTDLGRQVGLEPSTMTGLIDRMERDGLVYRSDDPKDRRAQKINLTERGTGVRDKIFESVDKMLQEVFEGIEPEQLEVANKVLRQVLTNVSKGEI